MAVACGADDCKDRRNCIKLPALYGKNLIMKYYALIFAFILTAGAGSAQDWELIWSDEFDDSTIDAAKWEFQIGDGCPNLCGWGNNELQYYRAENAVVENGLLRITASEQGFGGKQYTSARMRTRTQGDWTYGRFEARIRLPEGQGIWPAFWMLPTDEVYGGWPRSGEIDIMEMVGHEPATVHGTIHFGEPWPNNSFTGNSYTLSQGKFSDNFHEFAIEWGVGVIHWYVDGTKFSTKTRNDLQGKPWPFDQRFHFILNIAVGGNWPGNPDGTTVFPQTMEVDYIRVYRLANITGLEKDGNGNDIVLYPIPGEDTIRIRFTADRFSGSPVRLTLNDLNGAQIALWEDLQPDSEGYLELDTRSFASGIYLLQIEGDSGVVRKKISLR
jgi:beta-glucanase (GH16 family)